MQNDTASINVLMHATCGVLQLVAKSSVETDRYRRRRVLKVDVHVRRRISRLMTIARLIATCYGEPTRVSYDRADTGYSAPTADWTDRRIRAQLFSLPMKRVVISRRTRKHCNASTVSSPRGTASPSASRSFGVSPRRRFPCPPVLS